MTQTMLYSPAIVTLIAALAALGAPELVALLGAPLLALALLLHLRGRRRDYDGR